MEQCHGRQRSRFGGGIRESCFGCVQTRTTGREAVASRELPCRFEATCCSDVVGILGRSEFAGDLLEEVQGSSELPCAIEGQVSPGMLLWHWRHCTLQSWSMTRQGSCERGSCSVCCRFGFSDLVPKVGFAETSCCVDSICSKKVIGTDSMQKQPKSPHICPASELSPPSRGPRQLARKSEWGKCREQGSVSQVQRWLQERRKRCKNSNTEGLKCNNVPSQRRFLSMNRNQFFWTGASSWQAATGSTIRRLVAGTLAKQFMEEFEAECAPFQYALSTRAGTDCVVTVDGTGAYDHVLRSAMLGRLASMPGARSLLPFVRMSYAQPSSYQWFDDQGAAHVVTQAEGGEQGDPLMPLLFSIGIQGALEEVAASLLPGEQLCAFLDDVYLFCKFLYDLFAAALARVAGIQLHQGKTRAWNRAGVIPDNIDQLGPEVWQPEGITVLWHANWHRTARLTEDGRTFGQREGVVGSDPDSARFAVCLAASAPKHKPSGEPHHAHHAPECFSCVLPCARRGRVGHCQNLVGWSPRSE